MCSVGISNVPFDEISICRLLKVYLSAVTKCLPQDLSTMKSKEP